MKIEQTINTVATPTQQAEQVIEKTSEKTSTEKKPIRWAGQLI